MTDGQFTQAKILTIDVETAPLSVYTWGLWEQNVGLEQIALEWSILSYSAKWLDSKRVIYRDCGGKGKGHVRKDRHLLTEIHQLLDDADIVIGQNVRKFDLKKINARLVMEEFSPYSPVRVIDTMEAAKKHFAFTSNRLAWLSDKLTQVTKSKHRQFPGFELWAECLKDNPKAWAVMKQYNERDVRATEELYLKLRPWIANHPNMGLYSIDEVPLCPKCGSSHVNRRGYSTTNSTHYERWRCMACGGWSRGRQHLTNRHKRKSTLVAV